MLDPATTLADTAVALAAALPRFVRVSDSGTQLHVAFGSGVLHSYRLGSMTLGGAPVGLLDDLLSICQQIEYFVELANVPTDHGGNSEWAASVNEPMRHATARTYASPAHALMAGMVEAAKVEAAQ